MNEFNIYLIFFFLFMDLLDKVKGCLFGVAIGDALGLATEFMTRHEVKMHYPDGIRSYDKIIRDGHRSQWKRGEWSNDTEIILCIAEKIIETGRFDKNATQQGIKKWFESDPADILPNFRWIMQHPEWFEKPTETCKEVWQKIGHYEASNEALNRALLCALFAKDLLPETRDDVLLTHYHKICVGTSCTIAFTARNLLNDIETDFSDLVDICEQCEPAILPYLNIARNGSLEDLDLDDEDSLWYARKAMGSSLWTLWHCGSPEETLFTLIEQGGDADTNASLAMGLAGLKYGFRSMPKHLVETLLNKERIHDIAEKIIPYAVRD